MKVRKKRILSDVRQTQGKEHCNLHRVLRQRVPCFHVRLGRVAWFLCLREGRERTTTTTMMMREPSVLCVFIYFHRPWIFFSVVICNTFAPRSLPLLFCHGDDAPSLLVYVQIFSFLFMTHDPDSAKIGSRPKVWKEYSRVPQLAIRLYLGQPLSNAYGWNRIYQHEFREMQDACLSGSFSSRKKPMLVMVRRSAFWEISIDIDRKSIVSLLLPLNNDFAQLNEAECSDANWSLWVFTSIWVSSGAIIFFRREKCRGCEEWEIQVRRRFFIVNVSLFNFSCPIRPSFFFWSRNSPCRKLGRTRESPVRC